MTYLDLVRTPDGPFVRAGDGRWFTIDDEAAQAPELLVEAATLEDARRRWQAPDGARVVLVARPDAPICAIVEEQAAGRGPEILRSELLPDVTAADVVVIEDDDAVARQERVTNANVTHVYREGDVWFVDPVAGPRSPVAPTARQVARRRLAASPQPTAQRAAWMTTTRLGEPSGPVSAHVHHVVAHRVLDVVRDALTAQPGLGEQLWRHDGVTGRSSLHPVLAYPEPAPR